MLTYRHKPISTNQLARPLSCVNAAVPRADTFHRLVTPPQLILGAEGWCFTRWPQNYRNKISALKFSGLVLHTCQQAMHANPQWAIEGQDRSSCRKEMQTGHRAIGSRTATEMLWDLRGVSCPGCNLCRGTDVNAWSQCHLKHTNDRVHKCRRVGGTAEGFANCQLWDKACELPLSQWCE